MNSVCIATYNGEKYIENQLNSILSEIDFSDEIIIVDDKSTDSTRSLIDKIEDNRIKLYLNHVNKGPVYSFARAISLAQGEILYLSDQDDVWVKGRVRVMENVLLSDKTLLISSNFACINAEGLQTTGFENSVKLETSTKYSRNIMDVFIGKLNYFGCAMAFRQELKKVIFPFPHFVESHDLWIALAANLLRSNSHLDSITLYRRIHGSNASLYKRCLSKKIWSRVLFLASISVLLKRILLIKLKTSCIN